jgi:hypothetical protein
MPIPLGVLAVAGAGGGGVAGNGYEWLETQVLTSAAASVTFSNLNSSYGTTYEHLQVRLTGRSSRNDNGDTVRIRLNSDTGSNYAMHALKGSGSAVTSEGFGSQTNIQFYRISANTDANNVFGAMIIDILDPFSTNKTKTIRGLGGYAGIADGDEIALSSGLWNNTAALTTLELAGTNGNFQIGSRFSLYGMRSS